MIVDDLNSIFIHIPKTAGSFLTKEIFLKYSQDYILVELEHDGKDSFEIRGQITKRKHMTLKEYAEYTDISKYYIIAPIRDPLERLISLYFSPIRWIKPNRRARILIYLGKILGVQLKVGDNNFEKRKPYFDTTKFKKMIENTKSQKDYLEGIENQYSNLFVIRQEKLQDDIIEIFKLFGIDTDINFNVKVNASEKHVDETELSLAKDLVRKTKHAEDWNFIRTITENAINA